MVLCIANLYLEHHEPKQPLLLMPSISESHAESMRARRGQTKAKSAIKVVSQL